MGASILKTFIEGKTSRGGLVGLRTASSSSCPSTDGGSNPASGIYMVKSLYPHSLRMEVDIIDSPAICVL